MALLRRLAIVVLGIALCGTANKKVSVKEVTFDSAMVDIVWLGNDHKALLLLSSRGRLYRSTNGGDAWDDITDRFRGIAGVDGPLLVDSIVLSPADKNTVMVTASRRNHFISTDAGANWQKLKTKSTIHTFLFHRTRPTWALLSTWTDACEPKGKKKDASADDDPGPCNHMLYISKDSCKTFSLVASYVVQFAWGKDNNQQDRIYFTHFRKKRGDQEKLTLWSKNVDFAYTDDFGSKVQRQVYRGNKFLITKGFIFVAKLKDETSQTVVLMVSNDGGNTFHPAQLPEQLDEKSYTILDTASGIVMLHVNHGSKDGAPSGTPVGNVYVSDADGIRYALSLPNNVRGSDGNCEFDRVVSMEGTYMANFRDIERTGDESGAATSPDAQKKDDSEDDNEELERSASGTEVDRKRSQRAKGKEESVVRTVISFDKGGVWSYLKPPAVDSTGKKIDCPPDRCWLHLHGVTNFHNYAPFYSIEQAVGIIMGTGNVGPYLRYEPDQVNTFLSRDGGLSWSECHKGAYIYEFGDHGGLVVMANMIRRTKQVIFSWNEGQSWYDFEMTEYPMEVDNVVTEPNATSAKFLLYGTRGEAGVLYHLDFEQLGQPLCMGVWAADSVSSDYETWSPSDGRAGDEKCLLGRQVTYTRRKQTSECFNGELFERPVTRKNCPCVETDFECEMGFARKVGSSECRVVDETLTQDKVPVQCTSSSFYMTVAHRKVVGDSCEGGYLPAQVAVPCPASSKMSQGAYSVLGLIGMVALAMASMTVASRSDKFKTWFANVGFDSFNSVKYAAIGARIPENAVDSVGARFDAEFLEGDQDDFDDDAPQLMSYMGGNERNERDDARSRQVRRDDSRRIESGRAETAAAQVPRLAAPPGGGNAVVASADDEGVDLL